MEVEETGSHQYSRDRGSFEAPSEPSKGETANEVLCWSRFSRCSFCACQRKISFLWTSPSAPTSGHDHHIAGCLYPAFLFAPTRMNPSDCPTRNAKYPEACVNSFSEGLDFEECLRLSEVNKLRRFASNWVRLVFLLLKTKLRWKNHRDGQSWRFTHYSPSTLPASPGPATWGHFADLDFDMSLGFPGEGPAYNHLAIIFHTLFGFWFCPAASLSVGFALALLPGWDSCLSTGHWGVHAVVSHGDAGVFNLRPRDRQDERRAGQRGHIQLTEGRPVLERASKGREKLIEAFSEWLVETGLTLETFLNPAETDIDGVNASLQRYGRALFRAGRPYWTLL